MGLPDTACIAFQLSKAVYRPCLTGLGYGFPHPLAGQHRGDLRHPDPSMKSRTSSRPRRGACSEWRGWDCDIAEAWHHGGEIVSAVEAVLEFGEVAGYMLAADGAVITSDGALDVAEGGVDPT
jgi:hypothetical protein